MKKITLYMILAALFITSPLAAQKTTKTLTIDDAVNLALKNNIEIKQSSMDLELLETKNKYSWNSVSPSISASGGFNGQTPLESGSETSFSYSLGASLRLSLTPTLRTSMKKALLDYQAGKASLEATKRKIEFDVRKAFYKLIYSTDEIENEQRNLEIKKQTYESDLNKYM